MNTPSGERIIYLLERYTERTATPAELQELTGWMAERTDDTPLHEHLQRLVDQPEAIPGKVNWEQLYAGIMEGIADPGNITTPASTIAPVRRMYSPRKWGWTAAVLLVLGAGAYLWTVYKKGEAPVAIARQAADIAPGGNKAMLTLADGSTIMLDSATNGALAIQGGTQVLKMDGSLTYNTVPASPLTGEEVQYNTIRTPRGGQYQLILQDGSKVWLNAASSLRYPVSFSGKERRVEVEGEAYFEIENNKNAPFFVEANGTEVRVLGTAFNINAYADEGAVTATLLQGSILVMPHAGKKENSALLKPGEQAFIDQAGGSSMNKRITIKTPDTDEVVAWKNGLFQFNEANLEVIMRQLARWYDVDVSFKGEMPKATFRGKIPRNVNISQVLKILEFSDVHFNIEGNRIIVMP